MRLCACNAWCFLWLAWRRQKKGKIQIAELKEERGSFAGDVSRGGFVMAVT